MPKPPVHASHRHHPAYLHPDFQQSIPKSATIRLIEGDEKSSTLLWEDKGTRYFVPNVPYNQPIEWRIDYYQTMAGIYRQSADELRHRPEMAKTALESAARYQSVADDRKRRQAAGARFE